MRRATIADIAARAGVSKSTVSHTLSGKRPISLATQQRIRALIDEMGYRPSVVAQRLAGGGHSRNIGLAFPLSRSYAETEAKFIVNAANRARTADYAFLLLSHLEGTTAPFERVIESGLVDGFLLMQVRMQDRRVDLLRKAGIPFVLIGRCADNTGLSFVDVDIEAGVAGALAHLAALGHYTVTYLAYEDDGDFGFAERTLTSFYTGCQHYGLRGTRQICPISAEGSERLIDELLYEIPIFIYFSLNLPGETFATFKETLALAHEIGKIYPHHLLRMMNPCHTLDPLSPMSRQPEAFGMTVYYRTFQDYYNYCQGTSWQPRQTVRGQHRGFEMAGRPTPVVEQMAQVWDMFAQAQKFRCAPVPRGW